MRKTVALLTALVMMGTFAMLSNANAQAELIPPRDTMPPISSASM